MAGFLFILNYVIFENSYDTFHTKGDNIYRLRVEGKRDNGQMQFQSARCFAAPGHELTQSFDEITEYTRLLSFDFNLKWEEENRTNIKSFNEENAMCADSSFFSIFDFPLVIGDRNTVLEKSNEIMLSETSAKKYFGEDGINQTLIGKTMIAFDTIPFTLVGVFKDVPLNSHLKFDVLISYESLYRLSGDYYHTNWNENSVFTYLTITPGVDINELESKFPAIIDKYKGEYFKRTSYREDLYLQKLSSIHLKSHFTDEAEPGGNSQSVAILMIIAMFIIVIALVNYINLTTAMSLNRAKEVGIRKVCGSSKNELVWQFLSETAFLTLISLILANTFIEIFHPNFSYLIGKQIPLLIFANPVNFVLMAIFMVLITFAAGAYPAFILSGYKPSKVLMGKFSRSSSGSSIRKSLVILQLTIAVALIAGTITIFNQVRFMQSQELGVNIEKTLVLRTPNYFGVPVTQAKHDAFKSSLLGVSGISSVTNSRFVPGERVWGWGGYIRKTGAPDTEAKAYNRFFADEYFFEDYNIDLLAGRKFLGPQDSTVVILSETALKNLNFLTPEEAIGQSIYYPLNNLENEREVEIIGVTKDFHQQSLKQDYIPIIFQLQRAPDRFTSIKIDESRTKELLIKIKENYEEAFGSYPFIYNFLADSYNEQYSEDKQFGMVFSIFSLLAILIACLGLFGLSTFTVLQRKKEIGIRKALGASVESILNLLSKEIVSRIIISSVIALPFAYYLLNQWLQNYPFRISIGWWLAILPPVIVLIISIITIGLQTLKAAISNPVNALMDE
jgi:putative ABC transport system permease protein